MGRTIIACAAVVLVAGMLGGCREEEQGRPLTSTKGTYEGKADTALSKAQIDELTNRAALQGDISTSMPAAAGPPPETSVGVVPKTVDRLPESSPLPEKSLMERLKQQSGN